MEELAAETRRIMITAGRSYLQSLLDDLAALTTLLAPELPHPKVVLALAAIPPSEVPSPQHPATGLRERDDVQPAPPDQAPPVPLEVALQQ
jgi:hypothetical protein